MPAPYNGQCLCGAVRFRVVDEPLTLYACHCLDCQRRTGSAFALSMWVRRASLELLQGEPATYFAALPDGRTKTGRMCAACSTRVWAEPRNQAIVIVQPGTLEQPTGLVPIAHQWTSSAQPWMVFPPGAVLFETQPPDPAEMVRLWRQAQ
jgi:hypothetical protein